MNPPITKHNPFRLSPLLLKSSIVAGLFALLPGTIFAEPASTANSTLFGPNVYVFDPSMPSAEVQTIVDDIYHKMESNQFASQGYALLFKPGTYKNRFYAGFYTQVSGLGRSPDDVTIDGALSVNAKWADGMALDNFWRAMENIAILPSADVPWQYTKGMTRIAVSQAAPLRRVHVKGELQLFDWGSKGNVGYASGGFLADSKVDAAVIPASQQQWLSRNSTWGSWKNAVWNMVFVGCENAPGDTFPEPAYTVIDKTPVIREKPYLCLDDSGKFAVFVPALQHDTRGISWANGPTEGKFLAIDQFYVAQPEKDTTATLNAALAAGKSLLFTPGTYTLEDTLKVNNANTILMGLGVPSLKAANGKSVISVADVDGVTIAGVIIDAGPVDSPVLLQVGPAASSANHSANPTFLYDLVVRTGGAAAAQDDVGVVINSANVVADNLWIWRADHTNGVGWKVNPTKNGLIVNGSDVTMYGLFNEHHEEYQTVWNGNGGRVYFYQSEIPYDAPDQASWMNGKVNGYASYKVGDKVSTHEAWGVGIYCYFRDAAVKLESAIEAPSAPGVKFHHLTTVWLNGKEGSEITHIINNEGGRVYATKPPEAFRQTMK